MGSDSNGSKRVAHRAPTEPRQVKCAESSEILNFRGDEGNELAVLAEAERRLAECTELDAVVGIRDEMETLLIYAKKQHRSLKVQNRVAKIKIQAERRVGETLNALNLRGGDRKSKSHDATLIFRLQDLGINRDQSARWQLEASASNDQFESYCGEMEKANEEISSSGFRRFIQSVKGTAKRHAQASAKRRTRKAAANSGQQNRRHGSTNIKESVSEIRGHLESVNRMFAAICQRMASELEAVEVREIPRYLREAIELLQEIEQQTEAGDRH